MMKMKTNVFMGLLLVLSAGIQAQETDSRADSLIHFKVFGNCVMCKSRIENAVRGRGVHNADWNVDTKELSLRFNPSLVSLDRLHQKIANAGHDTEKRRADDATYRELPSCCLYRKAAADSAGGEMASSPSTPVMGVVLEEDNKGNLKPLRGASVVTVQGGKGVATGDNGYFTLNASEEGDSLLITYVGFAPQVVAVHPGDHLNVVLNLARPLEGIRVVSTKRATYINPLSTLRTQIMTEKELVKAACCNLSESFETNPAVDVSFSDAITGSKQIQMLGLSGNYTQLTLESLPGPRGLASPWGLSFVPGTWVESIQLSKGVGSVANGFESIAGQINVELKKPENAERVYANAYVNSMGKTDLNLNLSRPLSKKWSSALLLHDDFLTNRVDGNQDGFRDLPTGNLFTLMNRWKYAGTDGVQAQFGFRMLIDRKTGGEMDFDPAEDKLGTRHYGVGIATDRYELFGKIGYVFPEKKFKSIGLQVSAFNHDLQSYFGTTAYSGRQQNFYANLIYQSIIGNTNHKFRTGLSFAGDWYKETFRQQVYDRTEQVPGAFFEYTYSRGERFSMILGLRADHNNLFGYFLTPRFHLRYAPASGTTIRLAAGRGQRTANVFAENTSVLVSARSLKIEGAASGLAYGLHPEIAWNEGISFDQQFRLFGKKGSLAMDYFRTDFQNQVVADLDRSAHEVAFYDLQGVSWSNSLQASAQLELAAKLEWRLAWRWYDVRTTYHGQLLERPLLSRQRLFTNLAWEVSAWKFDLTGSWNGKKRLPYTGDKPSAYRLGDFSPAYPTVHAQVSRSLGSRHPVEVYLGTENLTNRSQEQLILAPQDPFGPEFDASLVWGPVTGRMFYGGIRFKWK